MKKILFLILSLFIITCAKAQGLVHCDPSEVGLRANQLLYADKAIYKAIKDKKTPGAVLCVVRHGKIAYLKAYGNKRIEPKTEKMTTETSLRPSLLQQGGVHSHLCLDPHRARQTEAHG